MTDGTIDVSGGVLNIADELDVADGTITQSGGIINIKSYVGGGDGTTTANKFDMTAGTLNLNGGTLNLYGQVNSSSYTAMTIASGVTLNATTGHTTVITSNNTTGNDEDMYIDLNGKSLGNVTVNLNGHELYLNNNLNVLGTLTLTNGLVVLGNKQLSLGTNGSSDGTISGGSSTAYVVAEVNGGDPGKLVHNVNNATGVYFFPIGDTKYVPVTVTLNSASLSNATIYAYTAPTKISTMSDNLERRLNRSWTVEPTGITNPNYDITYQYGADESAGDVLVEMVPLKLSAGVWYKPTNSVISSGTAIGTGSHDEGTLTLSWTGLTSFSEFGGGGGSSPLPVELADFTASCVNDGTVLNWTTNSENNSSHFEVQKSTDGLSWRILESIQAAGNSNALIEYSYFDPYSQNTLNYYRLNQVDIDGQQEYFGPLQSNCSTAEAKHLSFPNPSKDGFQLIVQDNDMLGKTDVMVYDALGKLVLTREIQVHPGMNLYHYNTNDWNAGIYTIRLKGTSKSIVLKQTIE